MRRKTERILVTSYVCGCAVLAGAGAIAQQKLSPQPAQQAAQPAPDEAPQFTLKDLNGNEVTLSDLRGENADQVVVLEWFDPRCDWVKTYHESSTTMKDIRSEFPGAKWAAVYSSTPPEGEDATDINKSAADEWGIEYPILLDTDRSVAELYGVERAPHVVVINAKGEVFYSGAVDDSMTPGSVGVENHLRKALAAASNGEDAPPSAAAPGCRLSTENPDDEGADDPERH